MNNENKLWSMAVHLKKAELAIQRAYDLSKEVNFHQCPDFIARSMHRSLTSIDMSSNIIDHSISFDDQG